jgi:hypothetical protein
MSEYIEIETELNEDDPRQMYVYTNLTLATGEPEIYHSRAEMEEGSPVAQALAIIEGIAALRLEEDEMLITRDAATDWHVIAADVSAALTNFFL